MTDRRDFLASLAGGTGLFLFGGRGLQAGTGRPPSDVALLNVALELEHTAVYAYGLAAGSGLLSKGTLEVGGIFKQSHEGHRAALTQAIRDLKGFPIPARKSYDFSAFELKTEADVLRLALFLEMKAAHAYQSALPKFRKRALTEAAGHILGDEVNHAVILRSALGKGPVGGWGQLDEVGFG
ncbi:MAG TPA: ferritin-like domain-containing protein [Holophagaceae bacterium]|nr:ferritin-like domain-containing protein [Holophagaceae bacterium]